MIRFVDSSRFITEDTGVTRKARLYSCFFTVVSDLTFPLLSRLQVGIVSLLRKSDCSIGDQINLGACSADNTSLALLLRIRTGNTLTIVAGPASSALSFFLSSLVETELSCDTLATSEISRRCSCSTHRSFSSSSYVYTSWAVSSFRTVRSCHFISWLRSQRSLDANETGIALVKILFSSSSASEVIFWLLIHSSEWAIESSTARLTFTRVV